MIKVIAIVLDGFLRELSVSNLCSVETNQESFLKIIRVFFTFFMFTDSIFIIK